MFHEQKREANKMEVVLVVIKDILHDSKYLYYIGMQYLQHSNFNLYKLPINKIEKFLQAIYIGYFNLALRNIEYITFDSGCH